MKNNNISNTNNINLTSNTSAKDSCIHLIKDRQVLIIYTGGTIGMMKGENGLTPKKNFLFEYMLNHPNLCDKEFTQSVSKFDSKDTDNILKYNFLVTPESFADCRIFYSILEFDEIIDSANMNLDYWKLIGRTINKFYCDFDAFIVLHGTDTMNYTACVLSFMFENLNKPVILTGSQIPLIEMRNDALKNLVDSLIVAGAYHIPEVTLMFNSKLFRGNRTIKNDNTGLRAFESPNLRPLIEIGINIKVNWDLILPPPTEEFSYFENFECHISVIKFFPIIKDCTFESFFKPFVKAVIIETYGAGKLPKDRSKIISIIKDANKRGVVLINVSQCRIGSGTNLDGNFLENYGVINAGDMTVECCLAKLSYLLGKEYNNEQIKIMFKESLRGELTHYNKSVTMHSNKFVNALLNLIDEKKNDENYLLASTLLPTVINELVEKSNLTMLKKLKSIIKMINFSKFGKKNPLHIAAIEGGLEIAKFLLNCRININEIDEDKCTPLNYACINKHRDLAMFLKTNGGILNQHKDMGESFCFLAYQGDLDSIKLYYQCGANLMIGDYDKKTVAHVSASMGRIEIIKFIIEETNVNIMVEDRWGHTPYIDATEEIKKLISEKFNVCVKTDIKRKRQRSRNKNKSKSESNIKKEKN